MQRYKQNINNVNIYKIITGVTIVLFPVLYRLDHCFTELSAASFLLVFFSFTLIPRIIFRENYSWRKNDTLVVLFLCWGFTRYFTSPVLDDTLYGGPNHVYQVLVENDGELVHYENDHVTNYTNAINCIDRHLDANRPIIVGVNHTPRQNINEGATDHWIVITGRGYDKSQEMYYYTYMDTGYSTARASDACNTTNNGLYYDPTKQTFRDNEDRRERQLDVTQVRPNDGQNLKETITQPARPTTNN